jgi:uncharacterized protein (TIGR00255 family)
LLRDAIVDRVGGIVKNFNHLTGQPQLPDSKPIQSMTGFAIVQRELPAGVLSIELRGVNSRFLDLVLKIPDELRAAEPVLRERLSAALQRGKLECRIALQRRAPGDRQPALDRGLLAYLAEAAATVRQAVPEAEPLSVADLLRWPGVWIEEKVDPQATLEAISSLSGEAIAEFVATRGREGAKLAETILGRTRRIDAIVADLNQRAPQLLQTYEEKLIERLKAALTSASAESSVPIDESLARVRQEITLYGLRIDVAEELVRLSAHVSEVRRVLAEGGPVGKRLDFLMQELNREANTLGSKAAAIELSSAAMELKLLIEQMREQVQNLE